MKGSNLTKESGIIKCWMSEPGCKQHKKLLGGGTVQPDSMLTRIVKLSVNFQDTSFHSNYNRRHELHTLKFPFC